jgi:hypothetical protein
MIKQSFLNSLKGLPSDVAEEMCKAAGFRTRTIPNGMASILLAFPNTIMLWLATGDKMVETAQAGDGWELNENE